MKKVFIIIFFILFINLTLIIVNNNYNNDKHVLENGKSSRIINSNALTMMFETEAGSGEYQVASENSWPQEGYVFNEQLSGCENGGTLSWNNETKKIVMSTNSSDKCYVFFDIFDDKYFYTTIIKNNPTILTREDFSSIFEAENINTIYKISNNLTEDLNNDGTGEPVYYFAGNALNNWVKFGKNEDNQDLYWRIIRINEDNSVRLLYFGTNPNSTNAFIGTSTVFNDNTYNETMYVGYMYGTSGSIENNRTNISSSTIKNELDNWYKNNLLSKMDDNNFLFDNYISKTAIYCNDRAYSGEYSGSGFGYMNYAGFYRLINSTAPSYRCGNDNYGLQYPNSSKADKFSASITNGGNGDLAYPIALITADEIVFAGGVFGKESKTWYSINASGEVINENSFWWTMTPAVKDAGASAYTVAKLFVISEGRLEYAEAIEYANKLNTMLIRPVISLKSCVYWSKGDGSSTNPYEVFIDDACADVEN